jgi:RHS repeat-associated protein
VKYQFESRNFKIRVYGSDANYIVTKARWYLSDITRPNAPPIHYDYFAHPNWKAALLSCKRYLDGRYLKIEYYDEGENQVGQTRISLSNNSKYIGHVSHLKAPVGEDETPIITHRFFYTDNRSDVRDAYNHQTAYLYNSDKRLTSIEHYLGTASPYQKYSTEQFFWNGTNLCCKALKEADGRVRSCRYLQYDDQHNVVAEHLCGNLSGACTVLPALDTNGTPIENGCERYTIHRTYSQDQYHQPLTETLPNGLVTAFRYKPNTQLITAKLVKDHDKILTREFSSYNAHGTLIQVISDNGAGDSPEDLSGVTFRRITRITPRKKAPCIGLPESIQESYLDLSTGLERLLGKTINAYSREGWLTRQECYDANSQLQYTLEWKYDTMGNVLWEQNALGQEIRREFDANGNKIKEQGPSQEFYTTFTYDFSNRLIAEEIVSLIGQRYQRSYRYDYSGNRIASIDPIGNETNYTYDDLGRPATTTFPTCIDINGTLSRLIATQEYDIAGNVTTAVNVEGNRTRTTYNIRGKPVQIEHPDGTTEQYTYNLDGTLQFQIAPNGTKTCFEYDVLGNIVCKNTFSRSGERLTTIHATYHGTLLTSETDPNGNTTYYEYDGAGRQTLITEPDTWTRIEYDSLGRKHKTIQCAGTNPETLRVNITEYDLLSRVIEERVEDGIGIIFTRTAFQYDEAGNRCGVTTFTEAGPATTRSFHDALGLPYKVIDAEDNESIIHYNYQHLNDHGQRVLQITSIDALGNPTVTTFDTLGRAASIERKDILGTTLAHTIQYYDGRGKRLKRVDLVKATGQEDRAITTEWQYDACGRLVGLFEAVDTPLRRATLYSYNQYGEKVADIAADGVIIHYAYDALGRLSAYHSSDGTIAYQFQYDPNSNIVSVFDAIHQSYTTRTYDAANRVTDETLANGLTLNYQYDGLGRVTQFYLPDASGVQYTYDAAFLRNVTRLDTSKSPTYVHHYTNYDQSGKITSAQMIADAGTLEYSRDRLGRLRLSKSAHFEEDLSQRGYDSVGNLIKQSRRDSISTITCDYTYDNLYQLTSEKGITDHHYAYDSLHNRLRKDNAHCDVNALNQLLRQGDSTYRYDPRGNRVEQQDLRYTYDALNRLIQVETDNHRWDYQYDAFNRRISKIAYEGDSNGWHQIDEERYLYQDRMEVGAVNSAGVIHQFRVIGQGLGAEIGASIAIELSGEVFAPIHDHSGNIITLLNAQTGQPVEVYRYTAYGEITIYAPGWLWGWQIATTSQNPWRFASKRIDDETSLLNFGRRYYDPFTGRWISPDPIGFEDGPNLYAYVHNNPLTHLDLYGLHETRCRHCERGTYQPRNRSSSSTSNTSSQSAKQWISSCCTWAGDMLADVGHHLVPIAAVQEAWVRTCRAFSGQGATLPKDYGRHSGVYTFPGSNPDQNPKRAIVLYNGICTSWADAWANAERISKANKGADVIIAYNATHGALGDLIESVAQIIGLRTHSAEIGAQALNFALHQAGEGGSVTAYGHSQGGLILHRSLGGRSEDVLKKIDSVTIGSAKFIVDPRLGSSRNIINRSDLIPALADCLSFTRTCCGQGPGATWVGSHFANPHTAHGFNNDAYQTALVVVTNEIMKARR